MGKVEGLDGAIKGLLSALTGLLVAFFAILLFAIFLPLILRALREPGFATLAAAAEEFAKGLGAALGGLLWALVGLIFAILVVWVLVALIPEIMRARPWRHIRLRDEALETLRIRYAKGEITKDQFLEMRKVLEED